MFEMLMVVAGIFSGWLLYERVLSPLLDRWGH